MSVETAERLPICSQVYIVDDGEMITMYESAECVGRCHYIACVLSHSHRCKVNHVRNGGTH